jgi:hypothetical protein
VGVMEGEQITYSDRGTPQVLRPRLSQGEHSDLTEVRRRGASRTDRGGLRSSTYPG